MANGDVGSLVDLSFSDQSELHHDSFTSSELTHYEVLGVDPRATRLEIREAYLKRKVTFSPDSDAAYSLLDRDDLRTNLGLIERAYAVLTDESLRRDYDRQFGRISGASHSGDEPFSRTAQLDRISKDSFTSELDPSAHLGTERLLIARGEGVKEVERSSSQRVPMPLIKLKATSAGHAKVLQSMRDLQEQHDLGSGHLYKELRLTAQVSEQEICDRTKVCITYIQAIEADDLGKLPQVVYVKGFLRSYFNYLAAPRAEEMVNRFAERLEMYKEQQKRVLLDSER